MPLSRRAQQRRLMALAACLWLAGMVGLVRLFDSVPAPLLQRIQASGVLLVATRRSPATYFQGARGPDGFEYTLVQRFAKQLGVRVEFVFPDSLEQLLDATRRGTVHLAAAGLSVTPGRSQVLRFSSPYDSISEQLTYRLGQTRPRSLADIAPGELHVIAGSSHEETLHRLRDAGNPALTWVRHADASSDALLAALDDGRIRLTVIDSNEAALSRRLYKHAAFAFDIGEPVPVAWAFAPTGDDSLREAADRFLAAHQAEGRLERLLARYFGHGERLNFVDTREFWRNVRDRLPQYQALFEQAAEQTGIDWRLLAAIGYQESHWQADAVSPTGVRGIMMLTQGTAKQMGIEDRNDPQQSIIGGAKYLRRVEKKLPERIKPPNRLWLTLAGYNVGFGHLEDARVLTDRDGADPDLWLEVKQRLPLLTEKKYYTTVRHGFARGAEPVNYVDNIRNYYDMLVWFTTNADAATRRRLLEEPADS